ncbi:glycoside hydrolase family 5 protein [Enterococcus timonensis]|uniref:glycoside hydrolase family 5 protein n=1 Tax=Enterococcus timonensis TaxID=1852364 RepID=UPI0008D9D79B|nr:cellulase family glycosylhydrolase [Enterococcus timonensis]
MAQIVNGFVRANGKNLVNDDGEILLKGWGIGNWLLQEGYMWQASGISRMDRPARMKQVVAELLGDTNAEKFWQDFTDNYFTIEDLLYQKSMGYNSIRLPLHWDLFLENEPEAVFKEDGFALLEKIFSWCQEADLYVILDLHGAPGGQTGANIDDSADDLPRLFLDDQQFAKGVALWQEIARRYAQNQVIGGFDLLNEPIRPGFDPVQEQFFVNRLFAFYQETIAAIRKFDTYHMISLEGHHWATNPLIFNQRYDDNYVIHFHRYATLPEKENFADFLALQDKWQVPLWLGETGENLLPWFSGMTQICEAENISYHFWPYKKMGKNNCPVTIKTPKDWQLILDYAAGKKHPGAMKAQEIFSQLLENLKLKNCQKNSATDFAVLRNGPYTLRATEFMESVGERQPKENLFNFHKEAPISIVEVTPRQENRFSFDNGWDRFGLKLQKNDCVTYSAPNFSVKKLLLFIESGNGQISLQNKLYQVTEKCVIKHDYVSNQLLQLKQIEGTCIYTHFDFL